jgi:hypothetical protein
MMTSEQQFGWLGQPGGGGSDFRKMSITEIKFMSSQKITKKNLVYFFQFLAYFPYFKNRVGL